MTADPEAKTGLPMKIAIATAIRPPGTGAPGAGQAAVVLSTTAGKVYYTLDGSDPRSPGGAVAGGAKLYQSPIAVPAGGKLFARVWQNERWSGPLRL